MHRSVLTFIVMGVSATALPAIAADIGMYRPGTPYSSIIAQAASQPHVTVFANLIPK